MLVALVSEGVYSVDKLIECVLEQADAEVNVGVSEGMVR